MKRLTVDPITRLEGHGRIEIFLDDAGDVADVFFQIPELRGFEKFCQGRPVWELSAIVPKICGVCPGAHHLAAGKAIDAVYKTDPPSTAKKLREMFYSAHYIHSHIAHFYALAAPDFVVGPTADPAERNILGVVQKVGLELAGAVIGHRKIAQDIQATIAGRATFVNWTVPGGVSKGITDTERKEIVEKAKSCLAFAQTSVKVFEDVVLKNKQYVDLILSAPYKLTTHYMGLVDAGNKVNFYDGEVRVVDTTGKEMIRYAPADYLQHIGEHVEPWSYLKFPFLKAKGWKGFVEGQESGVYRAAPLARLNAADGMATPLSQAEYDKFFKTLGGKPVHATLAQHWARIVEMLYAAERLLELAQDPETAGPDIRKIPEAVPHEGVGIVEAPRGTLTHHYTTDETGIVTNVNLIVGTTNNHAPICMSIKKAAQGLIKRGKDVSEGTLNMIEMAFRAYDPCFSCATHSLPGKTPLVVVVREADGTEVQRATR
ncbi:MAG: Ni/Fe hydrogenase subunit alpha [Deltaproteobacteria bacterium]|nr:Ni/Fe hydrogenase subunit alpha [Deltaproteobacteria bacterium]